MFKRLYDWTVSLAASPRAPWALGLVSFAESSFFPIPPDVVLAPMALARPDRAWHYAAVCTVTSVLGGMLGYLIGWLLFDSVGLWLLNLYGLGDKIESVRTWYAAWGALFILIKGLTPIPYKVVTIVSGALGYNFPMFVLLSVLTRGARFFILAGIFNRWGTPLKAFIERHLTAVALGSIAFIVAGFWLLTRLA
ncbi:YqaA family protein [uncultured Alsobacter sp.]|uniref:YqaA family protein n=1 Tax=uncultured Alsobacter sp. TaxID=1748258 RepID=UPI0025CD7477|nr:YqaA family protein [uncultured Alsobacter sp.]